MSQTVLWMLYLMPNNLRRRYDYYSQFKTELTEVQESEATWQKSTELSD